MRLHLFGAAALVSAMEAAHPDGLAWAEAQASRFLEGFADEHPEAGKAHPINAPETRASASP